MDGGVPMCDRYKRKDPCPLGARQAMVACPEPTCERVYVVCEKHGGEAAARRSLHSHRALYHTKARTA